MSSCAVLCCYTPIIGPYAYNLSRMSNTTAPDATNSWEDTKEETAEAEFEIINLDMLSKKPKHTAIEIEITSIVNTV